MILGLKALTFFSFSGYILVITEKLFRAPLFNSYSGHFRHLGGKTKTKEQPGASIRGPRRMC